jgi:hypothetical protein
MRRITCRTFAIRSMPAFAVLDSYDWPAQYGRSLTGVLALCVTVVACQSEPLNQQAVISNGAAPGYIALEINSPSSQGDLYWRYRITPSRGTVQRLAAGQYRGPYQSANSDCYKAIELQSPDGRFVARCFDYANGTTSEFEVMSSDRRSDVVFHWSPTQWRGISGFYWSPNSRSLAILNCSERHGRGVFDLVWSLAGHPVRYHTFYLDLIDIETRQMVEYVLRHDVVDGTGRVLGWEQPR